MSHAAEQTLECTANANGVGSGGLVSCPFCGSPAKAARRDRPTLYYVGCTNPSCACGPVTRLYAVKGHAVAAWNTRAANGGDEPRLTPDKGQL